jgi:hypothetical protein
MAVYIEVNTIPHKCARKEPSEMEALFTTATFMTLEAVDIEYHVIDPLHNPHLEIKNRSGQTATLTAAHQAPRPLIKWKFRSSPAQPRQFQRPPSAS